jgi:hypothetical protein
MSGAFIRQGGLRHSGLAENVVDDASSRARIRIVFNPVSLVNFPIPFEAKANGCQ